MMIETTMGLCYFSCNDEGKEHAYNHKIYIKEIVMIATMKLNHKG